jgi:hypothetical protein
MASGKASPASPERRRRGLVTLLLLLLTTCSSTHEAPPAGTPQPAATPPPLAPPLPATAPLLTVPPPASAEAPVADTPRDPALPPLLTPPPLLAAEEPEETGPRLGSIGRTTWIYTAPRRKTKIGYLRPGTSVVLKSADPLSPAGSARKHQPSAARRAKASRDVSRGGCKSGIWHPILPRGYICEDATTTQDLDSELFRALAYAGPRLRSADKGAMPLRYAFAMGAPMYGRIPREREQKSAERRLRRVEVLAKIPRATNGHEDLEVVDPLTPTDPIPAFLAGGHPALIPVGYKKGFVRKVIHYGSMLSYSRAFDVGGRTFLLTPELSLVPADRVRPFRVSSFHGVEIGPETPLPIGWFRKAPRPKFRRDPAGTMVDTGERWQPRTFVALTGVKEEQGGVLYHQTREDGLFVRANDVSMVRAPVELPSQVDEGDKWIEASLSRGTLTLWNGRTAVYSTLMSPGAGGSTPSASLKVDELVKAAFTPLGTYRISMKHRAAQMSSEDHPEPEKFWIADVPFAQYFRPPFAIHATYWHEDFGMPKSGGCINLSPADAERVFRWTEPLVPDDWAGANTEPGLPGTKIVITR